MTIKIIYSPSYQAANKVLIRHPQFMDVYNAIHECRCETRDLGIEAQCMMLGGATGAGKSTILFTYVNDNPRYELSMRREIPVLLVEVPAIATPKALASKMLEVLGDPASEKGTLWAMGKRLIHLLLSCKVELVILDDFHHLIDRMKDKILFDAAEWLKTLIKETNIPFLVVGIAGRVEKILATNAQLSRMFAVRKTLRPFAFDVQKPETVKEFSRFIESFTSETNFPFDGGLSRLELLHRLHYATDGHVANITNLLKEAMKSAEKRGLATFDLRSLSEAFQKRLRALMSEQADNPLNPKLDPFDVALGVTFKTADAPSLEQMSHTQPQRKPRKPKALPAVSETLKTHSD